MKVCRCPNCGSTKAHYDSVRSKEHKTFMVCPKCGTEGLLEAWEVARDWFVELAEGASVPASLPPQTLEERVSADARMKWLVMAHDAYAREDRVVAVCDREDEARRQMESLQTAPNADHMWIVRGEP